MRMHRPSLRPPPDVLHLYSAAVSALAEELRPLQLPVYCLPASALDRAATVAQPQPASPLTGRGSNAPTSAADDARPGLAATRGASLEQPDVRLSSTAQERLRTQRQLQDDLAGELLGMGAELKASTLAMQSAIRCGWCAGGRLPHCLAPQAAQHQSLPPPTHTIPHPHRAAGTGASCWMRLSQHLSTVPPTPTQSRPRPRNSIGVDAGGCARRWCCCWRLHSSSAPWWYGSSSPAWLVSAGGREAEADSHLSVCYMIAGMHCGMSGTSKPPYPQFTSDASSRCDCKGGMPQQRAARGPTELQSGDSSTHTTARTRQAATQTREGLCTCAPGSKRSNTRKVKRSNTNVRAELATWWPSHMQTSPTSGAYTAPHPAHPIIPPCTAHQISYQRGTGCQGRQQRQA